MSTRKKKVSTGVRYSDAQKKEVVDFVSQYNTTNGRGGQSAAAKKFKVTPLTIAAWLKSSGGSSKVSKAAKAVKAPKAVKEAKAAKLVKAAPAVKAFGKNQKGIRYTSDQKQEVVDFVNAYNIENGRGGQSQAAKKFNLSVLTVSAWLKRGGLKISAGRDAGLPAGLASKVTSLIDLSNQIRTAEVELAKLRSRYDSVKSSIQATL